MTTTSKQGNKMEFSKGVTGILSCVITLAISLAGFCYLEGQTSNEIRNIKEQQITIKNDLKEDIKSVNAIKADKVVVDLLFKKMDYNIEQNQGAHQKIVEKLDRLIEKKTGE